MARVTVWNEYRHEREHEEVAEVYPDGIHDAIAGGLDARGHETFPIFHRDDVLDVIDNAVEWASPTEGTPPNNYGNADPIEAIEDAVEGSDVH